MHLAVVIGVAEGGRAEPRLPARILRHTGAGRNWPVLRDPGREIVGRHLSVGIGVRFLPDVDNGERADQRFDRNFVDGGAAIREMQRRINMRSCVLVHPQVLQIEAVLRIGENIFIEELLLAKISWEIVS